MFCISKATCCCLKSPGRRVLIQQIFTHANSPTELTWLLLQICSPEGALDEPVSLVLSLEWSLMLSSENGNRAADGRLGVRGHTAKPCSAVSLLGLHSLLGGARTSAGLSRGSQHCTKLGHSSSFPGNCVRTCPPFWAHRRNCGKAEPFVLYPASSLPSTWVTSESLAWALANTPRRAS